METYSCVTQGTELYKLISPVFKQNVYSGVRPELKPFVSPVDLFYPNMTENLETFPLLNSTMVYEVTLEAGDCLFIPAFYWIQGHTPKNETNPNTLIIDFDF